jgi:excisionase family DNA binding protein
MSGSDDSKRSKYDSVDAEYDAGGLNTAKARGQSLSGQSYVTIAALAVLMSVDYRTARKWVEEGQVRAVKVGKYRIYADEVRHILDYGLRQRGDYADNTLPQRLAEAKQKPTAIEEQDTPIPKFDNRR